MIDSLRKHLVKFNYVVTDIHYVSINEETELKQINGGSANPIGHLVVYSKFKLMPTIVINKEFIFLMVSSEALPHCNIFIYETFVKGK